MINKIIDSFDLWTAAQAFKNNGRGATAENQNLIGIKKLRELILELAVKGKLVPQDPSDEPTSKLLKKILDTKNKLVKVIDSIPDIKDEEIPFKLPASWKWTRLGQVTNYGISEKVEPGQIEENVWILELEDVEKETSKLLNRVIVANRRFQSSKNRFYKGDVIYGKLRPYLDKVIIADLDGICTTEMIPIRGYYGITPEYLRLVLKSRYFIKYASESTHGMNLPRLGTEKARLGLFPLTSKAEQHRIVAKVDELMTLCDRLEQQQTESNAAHQQLVELLLASLTESQTPEAFTAAWQRFALNFEPLFTTEYSIDQLKQTILQLAVMGKLVPQDPKDEPASELLKRIAKEKEKLVKEGKIKKQEKLPEIADEEKPFELPRGWEFVRLGNIVNKIGSGKTPKEGYVTQSKTSYLFLRSQNVWNDGLSLNDVAFISDLTHSKMSNTKVFPNDILLNITGGSLGRSTIFPKELSEANVSQHVTIIRPTIEETRFYLHLCILSPYIQKLIWGRQVGMAREGLSKRVLELFEIPFPPLSEQHRIVAKVDELFALCDALKVRIKEAQEVQEKMAEGVVNWMWI